MFGISGSEFAVILIIALAVVGPEQLPDVLRAVGRAYRAVQRFWRKWHNAVDDVLYDADKLADRAEKLLTEEKKDGRDD